ncbi:transketolase [Vallitaleaceae bacterium 9-2]
MSTIQEQAINTIRILSAEGVQKANSGHPGLPMGAAPMAFELWANHMNHNPKNPQWDNRDRFILSAGHGSMLVYSLLHLFGYGLKIEDLKNFRQWDSLTPGHPEFGHTVGVETTTGPLGAGFATGIGMAMAEAHLASKFNKENYPIVDHYIYSIVGDGCLMEGVTAEAASLAGTLGLDKFIALYDSNKISIEGSTDLAFTEDVGKRFEAYHWQVLEVEDGNDPVAIGKAIEQAKANKTQPSLIIVKTKIGHGCPAKEGKASAHGEPLGQENLNAAKENLGMPLDKEFYVSEAVQTYIDELAAQGDKKEAAWNALFAEYKKSYPELAAQYEKDMSGFIDVDALDAEDFWSFDEKPNATRASSGQVIQKLVKIIPNLFGGSADLAPSTKTWMDDQGEFSKENYAGKNIHFGVRELAMTAMGNGLVLHGGLVSFTSTFFVFSDYMKPMIRLAALMGLPHTFVLTHDSIGVGEDGPTHQPIEQLASLRTIPNLVTFRPADAKEVAAGWYFAVTNKKQPTALVLTRQNVGFYEKSGKEALKGGYILIDSEKATPDVILMASGSEVGQVVEAAEILKKEGIDARVVSMPSMELFNAQSAEYKESVLPKSVTKRVAMEAARTFGWYQYVGLEGKVIGLDRFGASAPGAKVYEELGITTQAVVDAVKAL